MFLFLLALLFLALAMVGALVWRSAHRAMTRDPRYRDPRTLRTFGYSAVCAGLMLAVVCGFFSSFTTVDANTIGIVTAWGRPVGTVSAGPHFLAPWDSVETFSTRIQTSVRNAAAEGDLPGKDCVQVKLAGGADACSDLTVRYRIDAKDALDLWSRYGSFDTVRDKLVRSATDNAARIVWGAYQPQNAISGELLPKVTSDMKVELLKQLGSSGIQIDSVAVGELHLAPDVQQRINGILQAQTDTQIAEQNKARNQQQAEANQILSGSLTPEILTQQCIEAARDFHPVVFNCFAGGQSAPVIVNGGR